MSNLHRSKSWKQILDGCMESENICLSQIAEYIGSPYNGNETVFYAKLPRKRSKFIGIGMALGQPLEVINDWILTFSDKRRLYVKDISEDLIWIYLIGLNADKFGNGINYYRMYEQCQENAFILYTQLWDEITLGSLDTSNLEIKLQKIEYDDAFVGLKDFIIDNMDSFKTAYSKPRRLLNGYVKCILEARAPDSRRSLNSLRGFLDDSMINYLVGDADSINVVRKSDNTRIIGFKQIPTNRKTHINLCLALGMTEEEINKYLRLMGYASLRTADPNEKKLIEMLALWEKNNPLPRRLKDETFGQAGDVLLSEEERRSASDGMLNLRRDLEEEYTRQHISFPYYNG